MSERYVAINQCGWVD